MDQPKEKRRSLLWAVLGLAAALSSYGATVQVAPVTPLDSLRADLIINIPIIIRGYPILGLPRPEPQRVVTVQFLAQGDDWATVYINDRPFFRAFNTRRDYAVELPPGAYRLRITGTSSFDVWDSGYLDVGRNDANVVVVRYSRQGGVEVGGDPYAWFPD